MKEIDNIQLLLSSYIDGELEDRKKNEVHRLIDHDESVRKIYDSLKKGKALIESMPAESVPDNFLDEVSAQLERQMLLDGPVGEGSYKFGKFHLVVRRLMTVAAVLLLITALSYIVFDVFFPSSSRKEMMASFNKQKQKQILFEKPSFGTEPAVDKKIEFKASQSVPLIAKIVFNTPAPILADTVVNKAILNQNLFACTTSIGRQDESIVYVLDCEKSEIVELVGELKMLWDKSRNVSLSIGTKDFGRYIDIPKLSESDVLDILSIDDYGRRIRMASDIAKINTVSSEGLFDEIYADKVDIKDGFSIPKPTLASTPEPNEAVTASKHGDSTLTIVIHNR